MISINCAKGALSTSMRAFVFASVRTMGTSAVLAYPLTKTASSTKTTTAAVTSLKGQLKKEKEKLTKLNSKLKAKESALKTKQKERAADAKAKAAAKAKQVQTKQIKAQVVRKATKTIRGISPLNAFIKETTGGTLTDKISNWKTLANDERTIWKEKADEINAKTEQVFKPKPKSIASGYQNFLAEEHSKDRYRDLAFGDKSKQIAESWRQLSEEAKKQYNTPADVQKKAKEAYDAWVQSRVDAYLKHKATKKEIAAFESK